MDRQLTEDSLEITSNQYTYVRILSLLRNQGKVT